MNIRELWGLVATKPLLTRSDLALRWRITLRRVDQIRTEDPEFPKPRRVVGPRWTAEEIAAYETRHDRATAP